ncbi:MAG: SDR family oxidoreductase [Propionibacteriales bacterium]|nr:SDR family oxidoreductase [Propionibacteriales bacterium]MPZ67694.1 SDR family oxidoreductase [Pseudonocardiaceae bacterium]
MAGLQAGVAIVTGGRSGIGLATVELLRKDGFRVVSLDVEAGYPGSAEPERLELTVDVADEAQAALAAAMTIEAFGTVDVLVNNAGIGGGPAAGICHETSLEAWERVLGVNARGPFLCSRAVLPTMMEQRSGRIVTVASLASLQAMPGRFAYTASKGAALQLTRSIAADYGKYGIRANAVCPGFTRTPLVAARLDEGTWDLGDSIPLGRVGEPDEIANAILLLATGRLDYMSGAALVIDGGMTAAF